MARQPPLKSAAEVSGLLDLQTTPDALADSNNPYNAELSYLLKKEVLASLQQNNRERVKYAKWTFVLTFCWIFIVLLLVFLNGYNGTKGSRLLHLSDSVIITLITTTTINVFGFFLLVIKFLFNTGELAALTALINKDAPLASPVE